MATFQDTKGRRWVLSITAAEVKRIKDATGILLPKLLDDKMSGLGDLLSDLPLLVDVVFIIVAKQAKEAKVEPEDFGSALDGAAVEAMAEAFWEALADFFPRLKPQLLRLREVSRETGILLLARSGAELDKLDPAAIAKAVVKEVEAELAQARALARAQAAKMESPSAANKSGI